MSDHVLCKIMRKVFSFREVHSSNMNAYTAWNMFVNNLVIDHA